MSTPTTFDPLGPLPSGRVTLEASAGTGKTWTIAALATRYVAELGVPIEQVLIVTFTRAATSELRERVRSRLIEAARFLRGDAGAQPDPIHTHLAATDDATLLERLARLEGAIAEFDRATITTLHGFAHRLLREIGFLSAIPSHLTVEADRGELVDQVFSDLVVARYADANDASPNLRDLRSIATRVLTNPDADIVPEPTTATGDAAERSTFAHSLRRTVSERSETAGVLTYDDLLMRARDALYHPIVGSITRNLMAETYRVALVDEFQDTDRVQWQIVDALFPAAGSTLVIIGDPKQSIYAFRGADVAAYLTAADASATEHTLTTNWRSDGPLIAGLDTLMRGVRFGDDRIPYRPVTPAPGREDRRMRGSGPPVAVRLVLRDSPCRTNKDGNLSVTAARPFIARDAAAHVVDLLTTGVEILDDDGWRQTRPGDIAILCRTGHEVVLTQQALAERSVPAVVGRTGSVLESEAATDWLTLLEALEYPSSTRRVRRAALSSFVGWTPNQLLEADEDALLELHEQVTTWARVLDESGVPALWKAIERTTGVTERVLSAPQGERHATDLDQLTEILHGAHRSGARSLHDWLLGEQQRAKDAAEDEDTRARRLETDADAVQVLTIHSAKGLEFPIVLCPFLWNSKSGTDSVPVYHPERSHQRVIGVGGSTWDGFDEARQRALGESQAEEMRLFYVAVTRARHHLSLWWPACKNNEDALLARVLFGRTDDDTVKDKITLVGDDRLEQRLRDVIDRSKGTIGLIRVFDAPSEDRWEPDADPPPDLELASFDRSIDGSWRRTSFSGITAGAEHPIRPTDTLDLAKLDEPEPDPEAERPASPDLPMAAFPGGVRFGTLVHDILERIDFTSPDLESDLLDVCTRETQRRGLEVDPTDLATALRGVIDTPLFGAADAVRLRNIGPGDLLAEMVFEMPVAVDGTRIGTSDIAAVIRANLPDTHPLAAYADRLEEMSTGRFRGYLTGAIDVVARIGDPARFWVMDYKTNRLDWAADEPAISYYSPERTAQAMIDGDYVLQSLIYQVALHRYLGFRLDDYSIDRHLGGSLYLFVRGMIGPDTPVRADERYGVARWEADPALITAMDDLFTRGPTR